VIKSIEILKAVRDDQGQKKIKSKKNKPEKELKNKEEIKT
jgi:hypothetical protein